MSVVDANTAPASWLSSQTSPVVGFTDRLTPLVKGKHSTLEDAGWTLVFIPACETVGEWLSALHPSHGLQPVPVGAKRKKKKHLLCVDWPVHPSPCLNVSSLFLFSLVNVGLIVGLLSTYFFSILYENCATFCSCWESNCLKEKKAKQTCRELFRFCMDVNK